MKKNLIILALLTAAFFQNSCAHKTKPFLIGIQPNITVEPVYESGNYEFDFAPIVIEKVISSRMHLKFTPIVNYHFGGKKEGFSDLVLFVIAPLFVNPNKLNLHLPKGLYFGPVLGFGRNLLYKHYTTTIAIEPGYLFKIKNIYAVSVGMQFGNSYFAYDNYSNKWGSHFGLKFSAGIWLNR